MLLKTKRGRGDLKNQRRRRRQRMKNLPDKWFRAVELIDGNLSHYPIGYCNYHGAYVTEGIAQTHRCKEKECVRFEEVIEDETKAAGS